VSTGGISDPWTSNNPVTPPFAAKTAKAITTINAADAMTILRRLIFAECDRPRTRVLPPIAILASPDDHNRAGVVATTGPRINNLIARLSSPGNSRRRDASGTLYPAFAFFHGPYIYGGHPEPRRNDVAAIKR
jgi:hypothetical protein